MLPSGVSVRAWSPMSSASRHSSWISSPGRTVTAGSRSRFQRLCMTRLKPSSTRSPRGATTASGVPEPVTSTEPSPSASASGLNASCRVDAHACLDVQRVARGSGMGEAHGGLLGGRSTRWPPAARVAPVEPPGVCRALHGTDPGCPTGGTGRRAQSAHLTGREQLTSGTFGERHHADRGEGLMGCAQRGARLRPTAFSTQPLAVAQVGTGELGANPAAARRADRSSSDATSSSGPDAAVGASSCLPIPPRFPLRRDVRGLRGS